jgi:hypothetical protein
VEEYRAYFVGRDGHFNGFEPIVCDDDGAAIENARGLVNRHGIELWSGPRLVIRLSPQPKRETMVRNEPFEDRDLDAEAIAALEAARLMPPGPEKADALKKAGLLRRAADAKGIMFAPLGRPPK